MQISSLLRLADAIRGSGVEILRAELRDYQAGLLQKIETKGATPSRMLRLIARTCKPFLPNMRRKLWTFAMANPFSSVKQDRGRVLLQFVNASPHEDDTARNL
jgi:hypothetical protein